MVKEKCEHVHANLRHFSEGIVDPDELKRFEVIGRDANLKKLSAPAKLMYRYSKEDKLVSYEEHFDELEEDHKAMRAARNYLELYKNTIRKKTTASGGFRDRDIAQSVIIQNTDPSTARVEKFDRSVTTDLNKDIAVKVKPEQISRDRQDIKVAIIDKTEKENVPVNVVLKDVKPDEQIRIRVRDDEDPEKIHFKNIKMSQSIRLSDDEKEKEIQEMKIRPDPSPKKEVMLTKFQQDFDEMKRENELLKSKLSSRELEKPIFLRTNIPFKSWHMKPKKIITVPDNVTGIRSLECAIDLEYLIAGLDSGEIVLWKFFNGQNQNECRIIITHEGPINDLLYFNDGQSLISGGKDGILFRTDLLSFNKREIIKLKDEITRLCNPLNGFSIFLSVGNFIYEVDIFNEIFLNKFQAHDHPITDLIYIKQKNLIASSSRDSLIKTWDLKTKECIGTLDGNKQIINSICFACDEKYMYIVSVSDNCDITFWNLMDKNLSKNLKMKSPAQRVFYLNDKRTVCTIHQSGSFFLWSLEKDGVVKEFSEKHKHHYLSAAYFNDGHNMLFGTEEGAIELWNSK